MPNTKAIRKKVFQCFTTRSVRLDGGFEEAEWRGNEGMTPILYLLIRLPSLHLSLKREY